MVYPQQKIWWFSFSVLFPLMIYILALSSILFQWVYIDSLSFDSLTQWPKRVFANVMCSISMSLQKMLWSVCLNIKNMFVCGLKTEMKYGSYKNIPNIILKLTVYAWMHLTLGAKSHCRAVCCMLLIQTGLNTLRIYMSEYLQLQETTVLKVYFNSHNHLPGVNVYVFLPICVYIKCVGRDVT